MCAGKAVAAVGEVGASADVGNTAATLSDTTMSVHAITLVAICERACASNPTPKRLDAL